MNTRARAVTAATIAALWLATSMPTSAVDQAPPGPPAASASLMLGVLRNDGVLLPFAAFNGKRWSAPWPGTVDGTTRELPATLSAVPRDWWGGEEPRGWQLWRPDAEAAVPLALLSPVMVQVGFVRQLGFRTDSPPVLPPVPPFELPFPKVGLAVAGEAALQPIPTVSRLSPVWGSFRVTLKSQIDPAEERAVGAIRANTGWKHPLNREARARVEPELEAWYVTPLSEAGRRLSYIEAVKKYPPGPQDDGCGLETFVSGWVHHEERRIKTALKAVVSYCDRRNVSYMLPFGQMRLRDRVYWIFQMSGQDHEWYVVAEAGTRVDYVAQYLAGRGRPEQ